MITIQDWLIDISKNYSVQHCDDVESETYVAKVKDDIYLMKDAEIK
ncbi:hypothetical protein [Methanobrevibacter sp.]